MRRNLTNDPRLKEAVRWLLWVFAFIGTAYLAYRRYELFKGVAPTSPLGEGGDFWGFLHAARQIAADHSPYNFTQVQSGYGYVYSPLVALLLLPFCHLATVHVWHLWTAFSIVALALFAGIVTRTEAPSLGALQRPLLFGFAVLTTFQFLPTTGDLSNGQTDAFVLVLLAAAVLASVRGWAAGSGALIGLGAVIKTWPGGVALVLLRRGYVGRRRAFIGFLITIMLAPLLALAVGGASGFVDFLKITFDARSQHLVSDSVWGAPSLLFSSSGLAHPVLVSAPLRDFATLVLGAWVIGLLVFALRRSDSSVLYFWNVVACVVLILPVSHSDYSLYLLPILWIWVSRWLAKPHLRGPIFWVTCLVLLWWLVMFHSSWDGGPAASSLHSVVPFAANLVVVTVSVLGDHLVRIRYEKVMLEQSANATPAAS